MLSKTFDQIEGRGGGRGAFDGLLWYPSGSRLLVSSSVGHDRVIGRKWECFKNDEIILILEFGWSFMVDFKTEGMH